MKHNSVVSERIVLAGFLSGIDSDDLTSEHFGLTLNRDIFLAIVEAKRYSLEVTTGTIAALMFSKPTYTEDDERQRVRKFLDCLFDLRDGESPQKVANAAKLLKELFILNNSSSLKHEIPVLMHKTVDEFVYKDDVKQDKALKEDADEEEGEDEFRRVDSYSYDLALKHVIDVLNKYPFKTVLGDQKDGLIRLIKSYFCLDAQEGLDVEEE